MDTVCKLILAVEVGDRTLAMAQHLVHQITEVLAPQQLALFHTYHNFMLPHASLSLSLPELESVLGTGATGR